ncbi:MAG: M20/M25/M40 family metallo-hydrolase [Kiritimatiellaeota bacterium]|nr:M20/M25/M40 family metallo-hydrolase [Kiritimatiellota bacterium]
MNTLPELGAWVRNEVESNVFQVWMRDLLVELCSVDTTPGPNIDDLAEREKAVYDIIRREMAGAPSASLECRPVSAEITRSPHFSKLYYTQSPEHPEGLSVEDAYRGRGNLLCALPGAGFAPERGRPTAVNAHIDVVHPYFPPDVRGDTVFGRGACDDKSGIVSMIGAARLLHRLEQEEGLALNQSVLFMFVTDEETGGNGSLSLAMDAELRGRYQSIAVLECTGNDLHPANRGAVWYKATIRTHGVSKLEAAARCVLALEEEGARIKAESDHPLFPQRPVQTSHGILQSFGEHPSRINGYVKFLVAAKGLGREVLNSRIRTALERYTARYGDKTRATDPESGKPKVARHLAIDGTRGRFVIEVWGATGHMGSILENDCAITKAAWVIRALAGVRSEFPDLDIRLPDDSLDGELNLEGGQGFVPTHSIEEVTARMKEAVAVGIRRFIAEIGTGAEAASARITFDKLHNAAFDGDPGSDTVRNGIRASTCLGLRDPEAPVSGWTVSCDARLFACLQPGLPVLTMGPGRLRYAHSDQEHIRTEELQAGVEVLTLFLLLETGAIVP